MKKESVVICPPCGENVGLPTKRGLLNFTTSLPRFAVLPPQGGQETARGFTLIELLVVVLIIAILAAVALPQYQKAVYKARAVEAMTMLSSIVKAQKVYFLTHGEYTNDLNELDLEIPAELQSNVWNAEKPQQYYYYCADKRTCYAIVRNANMPFFEFFLSGEKRWCRGGTSIYRNTQASAICKTMGTLEPDRDEYYVMN